MTWIDDDRAELERQHHAGVELRARESQISSRAAKIYEELWKEILARITEAESKGLGKILTNGDCYQRTLIVMQKIKPDESYALPDKYMLALAPDQQSIVMSGPNSSSREVLVLALGEDNVVYIKHNGEQKNIPEAAKSLLRPILFPELYKYPS
jgi:hypothetical protein